MGECRDCGWWAPGPVCWDQLAAALGPEVGECRRACAELAWDQVAEKYVITRQHAGAMGAVVLSEKHRAHHELFTAPDFGCNQWRAKDTAQ